MSATTAAAPDAAAGFAVHSWQALGTTALLWAPRDGLAAAVGAAVGQIDAIDRAANRFDERSELSALNGAGGRRTEISSLALRALRLAVDAAEVSGGAVDPTIGRDVLALGYDRDWDLLAHVPASAPLRPPARAPVARDPHRWRSIELWDDPPAARIPATIRLDLGATAKALAADLGAGAAAAAGGGGVLLSLGGDVATCGPPPPAGWPIRVCDDHRDGDAGVTQDVVIHSGGLATSSLVARRWYRDGEAIHHIVEPRTGLPVSPSWRTASVTAADCAAANIAATAALVLGAQAIGWLARQRLPARLVAVNGGVHVQGGWPA